MRRLLLLLKIFRRWDVLVAPKLNCRPLTS